MLVGKLDAPFVAVIDKTAACNAAEILFNFELLNAPKTRQTDAEAYAAKYSVFIFI